MATLLPGDQITRESLKGHRILIYSHGHPHPPHVHVGMRKRVSDWDLEAIKCIDSDGFTPSEIAQQRRILQKYRDSIWRNWYVHWQNQRSQGHRP